MKNRLLKFMAMSLLALTLVSAGCSWFAAGDPQNPQNTLEQPPAQQDAPTNYDDSST